MQAQTEMRASFAEDGYLICDGFSTAQECTEMFVHANKMIAASNYFMDSASQISCFLEPGAVDEASYLIKPKMQVVNKIGHALHDLDPVFSRFSCQNKCADMVRLLGQKNPLLLKSIVICKQPFIGGEVNSHQDSTFLYTSPDSCIGLWFALEPETTMNGCMWAARGGHAAQLKSRFYKKGDKMVMNALNDAALAECGTPLEADTGTLVVLHGRLSHLSHENKSSVSRYAYAPHLIDGDCSYPDDNCLQ